MFLYLSWDGSHYVTSKYDGDVGLVKKLEGFKGVLNLVKYVGFKGMWKALSLRSTDELIVID